MSGVSWNTLVIQTEGEKAENFLLEADVASVIFDTDPGLLKQALFGAMAKFEKFASIQVRCFQLLQDCHLLAPPGIMNEEIVPRYDAILRTLSSWIGKPEVIINLFQLLSMIADRDVVKLRSVKVDEHELIYFINKAIALHNSSKPVQRAALQLFEAIIENSDKKSFATISTRIFKPVLDNLLLNGDDTSICFSSFSILNSLAGHAASLIAPWTDQIINLSLTTISKQLSGEVASQCLLLLGQMTRDKDSLLTVAGHERGLKVFIDALTTLRPKNLSAMRINLQILLSIIEDYDIATIAFQSIGDDDPLDYALKLQGELKTGFDKFTRLCAEEDHLDEQQMEDVFILHSQIDMTLEEMIKDVPEDLPEDMQEQNEDFQDVAPYTKEDDATQEHMVDAPISQAESKQHAVEQRVPFTGSAVKEEIPAAALLAKVEEEEEEEEQEELIKPDRANNSSNKERKVQVVDENFAVHVGEVQYASTASGAFPSALTGIGIVLPDDYEEDPLLALSADSFDNHVAYDQKSGGVVVNDSIALEKVDNSTADKASQQPRKEVAEVVQELDNNKSTFMPQNASQQPIKVEQDRSTAQHAAVAEHPQPAPVPPPGRSQEPPAQKTEGNTSRPIGAPLTANPPQQQSVNQISRSDSPERVPPPADVQVVVGKSFASVSPTYHQAKSSQAPTILNSRDEAKPKTYPPPVVLAPAPLPQEIEAKVNKPALSQAVEVKTVVQEHQTFDAPPAPKASQQAALNSVPATIPLAVTSPVVTHTFEQNESVSVSDGGKSAMESKPAKPAVEPALEHIVVSSGTATSSEQLRRSAASPQTLPSPSHSSYPSQSPSRDSGRSRTTTPNGSSSKGRGRAVVEDAGEQQQPSPDKREKALRREAELARARRDKETIASQKKSIAEQNSVLEELVAMLSAKDEEILRLKTERKSLEDSAKASEGRVTAAVMKVDQMKEALQIANDQSARAIEKANVTHNMFRDAVRKIEMLVMENEKVWNKFYELQSVENNENEHNGAMSPIEPEQQGDLETETDMLSVQQSFNLESKAEIQSTTPTAQVSTVPIHISTSSKSVASYDNNDLESRSPASSNLTPLAAGGLKRSSSFKLNSPAPLSARKPSMRSLNTSEFMLSPEGRSMQQSSRNAVEDSKLSVSIAGILEALEHVDNSHHLSVDVTHALYQDVQSTAEKVLILFNRLSQGARRPVSSQAAGNPLLGSTLPIRSLRTCLENMGLMHNPADPSFSNSPDSRQRTELLLSQFRAKYITLFGAAFTLVLCATEKNSLGASMSSSRRVDDTNSFQDAFSAKTPSDSLVTMRDVLNKVQLAIDRYLMHLENMVNADDALNPVDMEPLLLPGEFEDIVRLLEREKKPLAALFSSYTPWIDSSSKHNSNVSPPVVAINTADGRSLRRVSLAPHHADRFASMISGLGNRMRLQDAFCFAKDFTICPGLFSSSQLTELFNSVERPKPSNMNVTMIDQSSTERTLSFPQFVDFIYLCSMRCPLFRGSSGPIVNRLVNFFHLLNQSPGKDIVARRSRSAEIIVFRPPERAAVHRTANFARNGQVIPVATAVLVPSGSSGAGAMSPVLNNESRFLDQRKKKKTIEELRTWIVGSK